MKYFITQWKPFRAFSNVRGYFPSFTPDFFGMYFFNEFTLKTHFSIFFRAKKRRRQRDELLKGKNLFTPLHLLTKNPTPMRKHFNKNHIIFNSFISVSCSHDKWRADDIKLQHCRVATKMTFMLKKVKDAKVH